ncbi:hypothetical protein ACRYK4_26195 [Escherichia coli]|nr:hypothetical protein [Escherichia coli]
MTPQQSALKEASRKACQKIVARDQRSDDRFVFLTAFFGDVFHVHPARPFYTDGHAGMNFPLRNT